jgi:GTPase SAR1 family protein
MLIISCRYLFYSGLLEEPGFPSGITPTVVPFKLLLLGKSTVGKTSTVAKLAGKGVFVLYSGHVLF